MSKNALHTVGCVSVSLKLRLESTLRNIVLRHRYHQLLSGHDLGVLSGRYGMISQILQVTKQLIDQKKAEEAQLHSHS